jgi:hypothetical protein
VAKQNPDRVAILDLHRVVAGAFVSGDPLQEDGVHFGIDTRKEIADLVAPRLRALARKGPA